MSSRGFQLIENYIYFYHLDKYCVVPVYPERISDTILANFSQTTALGRSAPIFTYNSSGPRSITFNFALHRDLMSDIDMVGNNFNLPDNSDIIEELVHSIQAIALPKYNATAKSVNPPMIAVRIGNEVYIKGVVTGAVSVEYSGPIIRDRLYAVCNLSFTVSEVDPYDAEAVRSIGSFRGLSKTVENKVWG